MNALKLKNPIVFSLDVSDLKQAEAWVQQVGDLVGCIKLGPRILLQASKDWIQSVAQVSPLFIDCKFFDIPSTMKASVEMAFELGASIVTIHALSGRSTLVEMSKLQKELSLQRPMFISPVTLLTSFSDQDLVENFKPMPIQAHIEQLMNIVQESGLSSLICSPQEAHLARSLGLFPITPGVRLSEGVDKASDQVRVMTPIQAIKQGAWALVIGRPILNAPNPREWIQNCLDEMRIE